MIESVTSGTVLVSITGEKWIEKQGLAEFDECGIDGRWGGERAES
jgi:hypothetical protein